MKVKFTARGGWDHDKESAKITLNIGEIYDVESISIHKWVTYLKINGKYFNHCLFECDKELEEIIRTGKSDKVDVSLNV